MIKEKIKIKKIKIEKPDIKEINSCEDLPITYLHCRFTAAPKYDFGCWVNINKDSYLIDPITKERLQLISAIGIPYYPGRLYLKNRGDSVNFTLIFPQIPKHWLVFNLKEHTPDMSYLSSVGIVRNDTGVYRISAYLQD